MNRRLGHAWTSKAVAIGLVVVTYGFTRPPSLDQQQRIDMAARFSFERTELPHLDRSHPQRTSRVVNPSLDHLRGWISTVGAAVALGDLDGDGLPNDICHVDTRTDDVIVASAPGLPRRYSPFALEPIGLNYDRSMTAPMGCVPSDMNEDGTTDLLVYYWGRPPIAFLSMQPAGSTAPLTAATYRAQEIGDPAQRWYSNAATFADFDGDGHLDLAVGNYFPDESHILGTNASTSEHMHDSMSRAYNGGSKRLLLWSAAGSGDVPFVRYRDVDVFPERVATGWTLAMAAADLDGDLLPELYFANDFGPDALLHNRSTPGDVRFAPLTGHRGFATPRSKVLGRDSFKGMGADFGDVNNDGQLDIFVSNIAQDFALQESHFVFVNTGETDRMVHGHAPFVDESEKMGMARSGWGWDTRFGDFDNDGILEALQATGFLKGEVNRWPELHEIAMGNDALLRHPGAWHPFGDGDDLSGQQHNPFYVRAADGRYFDLAADIGLGDVHVSRGIATADVDGDGRLDFAVANQWEPSYLYRNQSSTTHPFIGLHLLLPLAPAPTSTSPGHPGPDHVGRPAIGAQATVVFEDGGRIVAHVDGGNGHSGKRSQDLHFGLGDRPGERFAIELRWRDPEGAIRTDTLRIEPGWHTVMLGWTGPSFSTAQTQDDRQ